jgi:hypothetical protein
MGGFMAGVNTDPDDLIKVANAISRAEKEIQSAVSTMQSTLRGAKWDDPVRRKFDSDFNGLIAGLKAFQSNAPGTVQHLRTKAAQLKQFMGN